MMAVGLVDKLSAGTWVSTPWGLDDLILFTDKYSVYSSGFVRINFMNEISSQITCNSNTLWMLGDKIKNLLLGEHSFRVVDTNSSPVHLWYEWYPSHIILVQITFSCCSWQVTRKLFVFSSSLENIGEMRLCSLTTCGWKVCWIAKMLLQKWGGEEFQLQLYQIPRSRIPWNEVSCIRCWKHWWIGSLGTWLGTIRLFLESHKWMNRVKWNANTLTWILSTDSPTLPSTLIIWAWTGNTDASRWPKRYKKDSDIVLSKLIYNFYANQHVIQGQDKNYQSGLIFMY